MEKWLLANLRYISHTIRGRMKRPSGDADLEDVIHETILSCLEFDRSGDYRGEAEFKTICYTIAARRVADFFRNKARAGAPDDTARLYYREDKNRELDMADLSRSIDTALQTLSPRQRAVVILKTDDELTTEDVAKILKISSRRVAEHYRNARIRLGHRLRRDQ